MNARRAAPAPYYDAAAESWGDRLTREHLDTDTALRSTLRRAISPAWTWKEELATPQATGRKYETVRITVQEARSMLRASLPYLPKGHGLRRETADLARQLHAMHLALITMKQDLEHLTAARALAVATDLMASLTAWTAEAQWRQATLAAGLRWPKRINKESERPQKVAISNLLRQQTLPFEEPLQNIQHIPRLGDRRAA
jgi:hypothetical protein